MPWTVYRCITFSLGILTAKDAKEAQSKRKGEEKDMNQFFAKLYVNFSELFAVNLSLLL